MLIHGHFYVEQIFTIAKNLGVIKVLVKRKVFNLQASQNFNF